MLVWIQDNFREGYLLPSFACGFGRSDKEYEIVRPGAQRVGSREFTKPEETTQNVTADISTASASEGKMIWNANPGRKNRR
jgi:hypothetical protein